MPTPHPTLPYFAGAHERRALVGGVAFLELASTDKIDVRQLSQWFEEHVVSAKVMARPSIVLEPPIGSIALRPTESGARWANANVARLASTARTRVISSLRGLIAAPTDDRFLRAGIFLGRVRREEGRWVARPEPTAPLSCIVLSLFSVSILSDRSFYDRQLCICDTCGRVSFDEHSPTRASCHEHPVRSSRTNLRGTPPPPESGTPSASG